jgi:hypothetical protein
MFAGAGADALAAGAGARRGAPTSGASLAAAHQREISVLSMALRASRESERAARKAVFETASTSGQQIAVLENRLADRESKLHRCVRPHTRVRVCQPWTSPCRSVP